MSIENLRREYYGLQGLIKNADITTPSYAINTYSAVLKEQIRLQVSGDVECSRVVFPNISSKFKEIREMHDKTSKMVSGLLESVVNKYETNNKVMEALLTQ
jgi:hypothetical protein